MKKKCRRRCNTFFTRKRASCTYLSSRCELRGYPPPPPLGGGGRGGDDRVVLSLSPPPPSFQSQPRMIPLPPPLTFSILGDDEDQDDDDDGWRDGGEGGGIDHRRPNAARFPISREEKEAKKCNFFIWNIFPCLACRQGHIQSTYERVFSCKIKLSQTKKRQTDIEF